MKPAQLIFYNILYNYSYEASPIHFFLLFASFLQYLINLGLYSEFNFKNWFQKQESIKGQKLSLPKSDTVKISKAVALKKTQNNENMKVSL